MSTQSKVLCILSSVDGHATVCTKSYWKKEHCRLQCTSALDFASLYIMKIYTKEWDFNYSDLKSPKGRI